MMRPLSTIGGVLLAISIAGCRYAAAPSDAGVDPSSDGGATSDDFCPAYAAERCAAELGCCTDSAARYESLEACLEATTRECVELREGGAAEEGLGELDEGAAEALLSRLREAASSCALADAYELRAHAAFRGTLGEGDDCAPHGDEETFRACADDLYCEPTSVAVDGAEASATCRRYASVGEACETTECAPDSYCAADGTCHALAAAAEPCASHEECESGVCDSESCAAPSVNDTWCAYGGAIADDDAE